MNSDYERFIKSHNLINRIYDMAFYFGTIKRKNNEEVIKNFFKQRLQDIVYVESLAKYFEKKVHKSNDNIDLKYNLQELIYDLNYLKQYLL